MSDFGTLTGAAIVTGASGGLGAAIARLLAEHGSDVAVLFRSNEDAANAVVAANDVWALHERENVLAAGSDSTPRYGGRPTSG